MTKIWLTVLLMAIAILVAKPVSIALEHPKDYEILEKFFRMGMVQESYGYVLEGAKPICIRNFIQLEAIHPYKDLSYAQQQFSNTLLVKQAIEVWKRVCSNQQNFALKAVPLAPSTGWEIQFINIKKLREVIEENIHLFRYVLGPKVQTEELVKQLAYSNEEFASTLKHDLVLTGIVLGFGTHNSVIGGRSETIAARSISKDCAPFLPKSQLMLSKTEHSMNVLTPQAFGTYFLAFAGGDVSYFTGDLLTLQPSPGFSTVEEEIITIDAMNEPLPFEIMQTPSFVFGAYKGGKSNAPFFDQLLKTQKHIQKLLKRSDFLEKVLEKIGGKKPIILCKKPNMTNQRIYADFGVQEWVQILQKVAEQFEDQAQRRTFFASFCKPSNDCQIPPKYAGASKTILVGLKKALTNLAAADQYFQTLSKDESLKPVISNQLYFKTTQESTGKQLQGICPVRIGYVVEDLEGNILFANCNTELDLSQTISGFAHGLQGMRIGEKRTLYIHPAYGYGALTTLPPCSGLVINTHLLDIDTKTSNSLPPLEPLDMEWFQDPSYIAAIESSIEQQPKYLGFLYKMMLDQIEGLDQSGIVEALISQEKKMAASNSQ